MYEFEDVDRVVPVDFEHNREGRGGEDRKDTRAKVAEARERRVGVSRGAGYYTRRVVRQRRWRFGWCC